MYQMSQSGCGYAPSFSPLESMAHLIQTINPVPTPFATYERFFSPGRKERVYQEKDALTLGYRPPGNYQKESLSFFNLQKEYHFLPELFLQPGREGKFVGKAEEIRPYIEEAFEKLLRAYFPNDIKISVCNVEEFRPMAPSASTIGLSINRRKQGLLSEIFVLNDSLARVMLTIGHELGHVLTETLEDKRDEEAKAYAFSLAWMKIIQEHNIANLGDSFITERPALNGLHDLAFFFVEKMLSLGESAPQLWRALVERKISLSSAGLTLVPLTF